MKHFKAILILIFLGLFSLTSFSQGKLDNYKYVIINKDLNIKKKLDQFDINKILQSHLNSKNFEVYVEGDAIPSTLKSCDMLRVKINETGFLTTKIVIDFKDCNGHTIYSTKKGISRIKTYKESYYEAFRNSLKDDINLDEHQFVEK